MSATFGAAACSVITSFDGLTTLGKPVDTVEAGEGGAVEAGPLDAGSDANTPAGDASKAFSCADHGAALLCADFDGPLLQAAFDSDFTQGGGSFAASSNIFVSPPHALVVDVPTRNDADHVSVMLEKAIASKKFALSYDLRVDDGGGDQVAVDLGGIAFRGDFYALQLRFVRDATARFRIYEFGSAVPAKGYAPQVNFTELNTYQFEPLRFVRVTFELDIGASQSTLAVSIDGKLQKTVPLVAHLYASTAYVQIGVSYTDGRGVALKAWYDDVLVEPR